MSTHTCIHRNGPFYEKNSISERETHNVTLVVNTRRCTFQNFTGCVGNSQLHRWFFNAQFCSHFWQCTKLVVSPQWVQIQRAYVHERAQRLSRTTASSLQAHSTSTTHRLTDRQAQYWLTRIPNNPAEHPALSKCKAQQWMSPGSFITRMRFQQVCKLSLTGHSLCSKQMAVLLSLELSLLVDPAVSQRFPSVYLPQNLQNFFSSANTIQQDDFAAEWLDSSRHASDPFEAILL